MAYFNEFSRLTSDYLRRSIEDMNNSKIVISPLFYRKIRDRINEENFLRFENESYGIKYTLYDLNKEAFLNMEIYRRREGGRVSTLALRKLEVLSNLFR